jgi:hypothetical protein
MSMFARKSCGRPSDLREIGGLRLLLFSRRIQMSAKTEGSLAIAAALLVLFTAMLDPFVSLALSIIALLALGVYKFVYKGR